MLDVLLQELQEERLEREEEEYMMSQQIATVYREEL
jgi:hypothetical protein